jgi:hypothetical protein
VLELLNSVSMAKRMANMVRLLPIISSLLFTSFLSPLRSCDRVRTNADFLSIPPFPPSSQSLSSDNFGARKDNNRQKNGVVLPDRRKTDNKSANAAGKGGAVGKGKSAAAGKAKLKGAQQKKKV